MYMYGENGTIEGEKGGGGILSSKIRIKYIHHAQILLYNEHYELYYPII